MPLDLTPLLPAVGTFAAAIVAGGVARSTLIATKETKVSEFRQAWINSLREDLATLFSNTRTLARAMQEARASLPDNTANFRFAQDKITAARHETAETYYRIKLRLNRNQDDHKELLRLLGEMMMSQQQYWDGAKDGDVQIPLDHVDRASDHAEAVLKSEWRTVKGGEPSYRNAVTTTTWVLIVSCVVWVTLVIGVPAYGFFFPSEPKGANPASMAKGQQPAAPSPSKVTSPKAEPARS